ncbi:MAG: GSCFA domain-containing protein [Alphaproteobacteria bacterium]|nr:GSCFA domain-containing protein [Alphaproteobacteria bacterium]
MPLERYSYSAATRGNAGKARAWPRDKDEQDARLTPFCKPLLRPNFKISRDDLLFTIGSCFARNIEKQLIAEGYNVAADQFEKICADHDVIIESTVMNKFVAHSVENEIRWALDPEAGFPDGGIVQVKADRYIDLQLAPGFRPMPLDKALALRHAVGTYVRMIKDASIVIMTLGLAEAWFDKALGIYLNSPPMRTSAELHPGRFELHVLEYDDIVGALERILGLLDKYGRKDYRFLLTVSPVAMGSTFTESDVFVANCYSKSVQRAAAEHIWRKHPQVDYLPTYESVTLSERPVAWRDDCAHVSDEIVRLNVRRMMEVYTEAVASQADGKTAEAAREDALELCGRAKAHWQAREFDKAMALFQQAKSTAPGEMLVRLRFGEFLVKRRLFNDALVELATAQRLGGARYGSAFELGRTHYALENFEQSETFLREAALLQPTRAAVHWALSKTLARREKPREAVRSLRSAVLSAPEREDIWSEYVQAAGALGLDADFYETLRILKGEEKAHPTIRNYIEAA